MNLTDLKAKATAAELTLIEKVEELVRAGAFKDAEDVVMRRAKNWIALNRPSVLGDFHDWCKRLVKAIRGK